MKRKIILNIIILFLIASCKPESDRALLISEDLLEVSYGANEFNKMDIYLPEKRNGNTRTIILIHGGFWYAGDKNELTDYAKYFRDKGFACVTMNYRLTNTAENNVHPAQINDVAKAIDYMSSRATEFHISSGRFGLLGYSAGAHIALLYTYAANYNEKVKTVVSIAGPSDLRSSAGVPPTYVQLVTAFIGASPQQNPSAYVQANPITHVKASSKPTLLIHGKLDNIVPYQSSVILQAKLIEFNVKNDLRLYDNVGHDFNNPATVNSVLQETVMWLEENLR